MMMAAAAQPTSSLRVVAHFDKNSRHAAAFSSDDLNEPSKKLPRGMLMRPSKDTFPTSKSYQSGLANKSNSIPIPQSGQQPHKRRTTNHRHTRSLPADAVHSVLSASPVLSPDALVRIKSLARRLTFQFPLDAPGLRRVIANPEAALGFGSHAAPSKDALVAGGFYEPVFGADGMTGENSPGRDEPLLYVFIDHSNILVGFIEWVKKQPAESFPGLKRPARPRLSHAALVLLLARGRQCMRKVLVASSPLHQSLDEIAGMGYQISVLQRVEIKEGASSGGGGGTSPMAGKAKRKQKGRTGDPTDRRATSNSGSSTESDSGGGPNGASPPRLVPSASPPKSAADPTSTTPPSSGSPSSRPRFREEAVDELLQLKLLQTLLDAPSPPPPGSTIVLASGDAARSQFNPRGFLGCVRKAVERGWKVEVAGWDEGRSRAYGELVAEIGRGEVPGKELGGAMSLVSLDRWGMDLVEGH